MTNSTATRTSPDYLARDTYEGRWTRVGLAAGQRSDLFYARELAAMLGQDGQEFTVWEASGHVRAGQPLFVRTRFVANADGSLTGYNAEGGVSVVHPADRVVGVLTR
jgi:hypothetical protein